MAGSDRKKLMNRFTRKNTAPPFSNIRYEKRHTLPMPTQVPMLIR